MFHPDEGRIAPATSDNIKAAQEGKLIANFPFMSEANPPPHPENAHPVTGSNRRYMLFDWFHQENCRQPTEVLRRTSLVEQLAGRINTQAAEQLHRDKARDIYWLNEMGPTNHVFAFRLVAHLRNMEINRATVRSHVQKLPTGIKLDSLGQLSHERALDALFGDHGPSVPEPVGPSGPVGPSSPDPVSPSMPERPSDTITRPVDPSMSERGSHTPAGPADSSDHVGRSATEPVGHSIPEQGSCTGPTPSHTSPPGPIGPVTGRGHRHNADAPTEITLDGCQYRRIVIPGDGNCLFRSVCELHPDLSQDDHLDLRKRTHD